jgi:mRNA deadenylase 3'-5' endonuclease subunit Ccr4
MHSFQIIKNESEIKRSKEWSEVASSNYKNKLVNKRGNQISGNYHGKRYRIISVMERKFCLKERVARGFLGVVLAVSSGGLALISKDVRTLFTQPKKIVFYGKITDSSARVNQTGQDALSAQDKTQNKDIFNVLSYNILVPHYAEHEKPSLKKLPWKQRKETLANRVVQLEPDCICLQEVEHFDQIAKCMANRGYYGVFAKRNNSEKEGCATFYNHRKVDLLSSNKCYFNDGTGRMILQVVVKPKNSDKKISLLNTHVIWESSTVERRSKEIKKTEEFAFEQSQNGQSVIVCGDLNTTRNDGDFLKGFLEKGFVDTVVQAGNSWKNSFVEKDSNGKKYFTTYDYIFSKNIQLVNADINGDPNDLKSDLEYSTVKEPSDHLPIIASFKLGQGSGQA